MKVYTKTGDQGSTGLLYGGRVAKNHPAPTAYGDVDEAQAVLGLIRAQSQDSALNEIIVQCQRDLYVLMAELATLPENHDKLTAGTTCVSADMVTALETIIDHISTLFEPPKAFVLPGQNMVAGYCDLARTVVRRAERSAISATVEGSQVLPYLNRLSDLMWALARWQEDHDMLRSKK